jgi:hypothetical protein
MFGACGWNPTNGRYRPINGKDHDASESATSSNAHGHRIAADDVVEAVARAPLRYQDGSIQVVTPDGNTSFVELGQSRVTRG